MRLFFKKAASAVLTAVMILSAALAGPPITSYAENRGFSFSGSGTENDPYLISTVQDLEEMRNKVNDYYGADNYKGIYYKLTNDLDLSDIENWVPIGNPSNGNPFTGIFDGAGHEIKNITINRPDNHPQGFFGIIQYGAVKNLTVSGSVTGKSHTGGIAGSVLAGDLENCVNKCTVTNVGTSISERTGGIAGAITYNSLNGFKASRVVGCVNLGTVSGQDRCGGITGEAACILIENCRNEADVLGSGMLIGGIAGMARDTSSAGKLEITGCENAGKIKGITKTGGIVGDISRCGYYQSTVNNSVNTGEVEGKEQVGGICGYNYAGIELCVNKGAVKGVTMVGGICGENNEQNVPNVSPPSIPQISIRNCINEGTVSGTGDYVGGLIGRRYVPTTSYNVGKVTGGGNNVGGTCPNGSRVSFFNSDLVTGVHNDVSAKTTESFQSGEVAWLFSQEENGQGNLWGQNIDNGQPKQDYPVFNGAKVYRYEIINCDGSSKNPQEFGYTNNENFGATLSVHSLTHIDAKDADCANKGNIEYWHCSVCEKNFSDSEGKSEIDNVETDKTTEHQWDSGTITVPPTEESKGVKTFTCTVCGAVKTEELGKTPHEHKFSADWTSDETGHWHAATCGHDAAADWEEHRPNGEWQKTDEQHWKICAVCHAEIGKNAHTWDGGSVSVPPGGEGGGVKTFTCTVCGAVREENLTDPGHTHVWGDSYEKDSGSHWLICTGCGEAGEKAAHRWNGGEVTVPPTQSTAGERQFACTVCGITRTEAIPPAGRPSGPSIPAKPTVPVGTDTPEENPPVSENPENPDSADDPSVPEAPDRTEDKNPSAEPEEPEKTDDSAEPETPEQSGDSGQRNENSADPEQSGTPGGTAVKDVRPGENAPGAVLATPIDELIGAVLTKEERQNLLDGADIRIILTVEDGTDSVPAEGKAAVEAALAGLPGYRLGQYLDVSLLKIMGNVQEKITRTNRLITVTFEIPETLRKSDREYAVIRVHDGKAAVLGDLDNDENTVTIRTDRFSTYALVFSGEEENPPTGTALPALLPAALSAALTILTKRSKEKGKGK